MGVWIETYLDKSAENENRVTPCMGVWIETKNYSAQVLKASHTLYGCVDWNN